MIQELFGGGGSATNPTSTLLLGERSISSNPFSSSTTSSPLLTNTTTTTNTSMIATTPPTTVVIATAMNTTNTNNSDTNANSNSNSSSQNLRCPRCDSTNTKFCYYNNYNLTQPRHFCKTCRRYWTKGGTLRNVPIGGGCRKNKSCISTNNSATSGTMAKSSTTSNNLFLAKAAKANFSSEMLVNDNSLFLGPGLLDHSPWSSPLPQPQNSHILALLRGSSPFPNPNPNPNPSHASSVFTSLGLDSYGNGSPSLLGSFTRNNQHQLNGFAPDFMDNNGSNNNGGSNIMDLYQRLKASSSSSSSSNNNYGYCNENNPGSVILGHMVGPPASSSSLSMNTSSFDATPFGGGGGGGGDHLGSSYGFMGGASHPAISSWSDFPAVPINGAYP